MFQLAEEPRVVASWRRGWDSDHYLRLRRWYDEGFRPGIVYDIGAHAGSWSEMCNSIFAPRQCYLFEPQPEYQERARKRPQSIKGDWEIVPVALGDRDETSVMFVTENRAASSMLAPLEDGTQQALGTGAISQDKVQVVMLDGLAARRGLPAPDLVKIDVQGYEGRVLAGGKAVLSKAERMVIEVSLRPIYRGQPLLPAILETVCDWGFELEDLSESCRGWAGPVWQVDLWLRRRS